MIVFPDDLMYSREHTWARVDGNLVTIGVTDFAQEKLGEILHVELPQIDLYMEQDEPFGTIESSKTVTELISPVSGDIVRVNEDLLDDMGIINSDPYDTGWMIVVELRDLSELDNLLNAAEYRDYVGGEAGLD
ncbi:MAG: glycine cleavage system protein GcvH [Syntrophales bacterium]|nr:glycine cleavage system protein GcvH [Syntrophales bacterium]MDD5231943.1 glycine cleavage system protein GcvH [Syntrophales bacterium]MDD5531456.1 glycine cleavage system protein GcvH [Syntrophales bacterium]